MTDKEIIKALECLTGEMIPCKDCPYSANYTHFDCQRQVAKDALDLINRQQAEIKTLQERNVVLRGMIDTQKAEIERLKKLLEEADVNYNKCAKRFYKEGVKEFAERLKKEYTETFLVSGDTVIEILDNLVKEMVGDTE